MTRAETLAAIAALPVSDAVKQHATRLIEGLPEWMNEIEVGYEYACDKIILRLVEVYPFSLNLSVGEIVSQPYFVNQMGSSAFDDTIHDALRQLTGMVALTRGG